MIKQQVQVKINMPLKLKRAIEEKAKKYDLTLASYVKYAVFNQLNEEPVFVASKKVENSYKDIINGNSKLVKFSSTKKLSEYIDKMK